MSFTRHDAIDLIDGVGHTEDTKNRESIRVDWPKNLLCLFQGQPWKSNYRG
jgi:hypothetical protein